MKISVITINRNNVAGLKKTLASVIAQTHNDVEFIVIDGASTDGSVDAIKTHAEHISQWISEPDTGIYNAMNKGIERATGDYLIFMNSGDCFANDTILQQFSDGDLTEDIVFGNQIRVMADGTSILWKAPDKIDFLFFYAAGLPHQSTFICKKVFEILGPYREDFKIYSDWEHIERAVLKYGMTCRHIPLTVSIYDKCGISSNPEQRHIRRHEIAESRNELFQSLIWEMAEECLRLRRETQALYKNPFIRFLIAASKKLRKKISRIRKRSKYIDMMRL